MKGMNGVVSSGLRKTASVRKKPRRILQNEEMENSSRIWGEERTDAELK